jgi:hypothetical protein
MINIPTYRAKLIRQAGYITGYLVKDKHFSYLIDVRFLPCGTLPMSHFVEIDPSTLAINFPDMKDSNDKPIFASLSESGKGGDIVKSYEHFFSVYRKYVDVEQTVLFEDGCYTFDNTAWAVLQLKKIEVIGIQND